MKISKSKKLSIGVTGQNGFVGSHLVNTLRLLPDEFNLIPFVREFFDDDDLLDSFTRKCDVIVHLAALNRHDSERYIYDTNISLGQSLINSLNRTQSTAHVLVSSSTQEEKNNLYGKSKREVREAFNSWSEKSGAVFSGLIIPNVFGAFGKPYYNSFISTFCYQLVNGEVPKVEVDSAVNLIYIQELIFEIINVIRKRINIPFLVIKPTSQKKVSEVLDLLKNYQNSYLVSGSIPNVECSFSRNLFNTFRSYIDYKTFFPKKYILNEDQRGSFVEIIRMGSGGQSSFSITFPGVIRGNHFHTRKIERFSVIKGEAIIQLRKVGTNEVIEHRLSGENPSYVDMPIWYTHNIKNIGEEDLYTMFWINEPYNNNDSDTYFEEVSKK